MDFIDTIARRTKGGREGDNRSTAFPMNAPIVEMVTNDRLAYRYILKPFLIAFRIAGNGGALE